jgi:hypothetical protein
MRLRGFLFTKCVRPSQSDSPTYIRVQQHLKSCPEIGWSLVTSCANTGLDIRHGWDPARDCGTYDSGLTIRDSKIGWGRGGTPVRDIVRGGEWWGRPWRRSPRDGEVNISNYSTKQMEIQINYCVFSYSTTNKMNLLSRIIYSCKTLYVFRTVFLCPSSGVQNYVYSNGICQTAAAIGDEMELHSISSPIAAGSSSYLTYTVDVYAVLSSWWWTERPSETCRAIYKNK